MCYTYDNLSRVTARTLKKLSDNSVISTETFNYDAAGNVTSAPDSSFQYDTNNRLISFNGNSISYDLDGNMLSNGTLTCTYDSANRLVSAGGHTYTYNAEDVRIRNLCAEEDTTYTYNTNVKLSMLLMKTTNGVVTKYVYGKGLIGEEVSGAFKTYHFDCRGSTIAITDASGNITDTFAYDTYGKLISRTGTNKVIFGYNGRDGVVTEDNGLIYMRARYYSPAMKRFINADIVAGEISNAITLNRFAYANGNPVSNIDPFGLMSDEAMYIKMLRDEQRLHSSQENSRASYERKISLDEKQIEAAEARAYKTSAKRERDLYEQKLLADENNESRNQSRKFSIVENDWQTTSFTSMLTYVGCFVASIWDKDIRNDMNNIHWNLFNTDAERALESTKVSFYKGSLVIRVDMINGSSCGVLGMILLDDDESPDNPESYINLNHEKGHNIQEAFMGTLPYLICVGAPSAIYCQFGDYQNIKDESIAERMYYSKIWERTADWLGGVDRNNYDDFWTESNFVPW